MIMIPSPRPGVGVEPSPSRAPVLRRACDDWGMSETADAPWRGRWKRQVVIWCWREEIPRWDPFSFVPSLALEIAVFVLSSGQSGLTKSKILQILFAGDLRPTKSLICHGFSSFHNVRQLWENKSGHLVNGISVDSSLECPVGASSFSQVLKTLGKHMLFLFVAFSTSPFGSQ